MKLYSYIAASCFAIAGLAATSCADSYFDVEDTGTLDTEQSLESVEKHPSAFMQGIWSWYSSYSLAGRHDSNGYISTLIASDVMGSDVAFKGQAWYILDHQDIFNRSEYARPNFVWNLFYTGIAKANEILEFYPEGPSNEGENVLVGQALAARAFAYLNLIQWFQAPTKTDCTLDLQAMGVPMMYTATAMDGNKTEEEIAAAKGRNTVEYIFDQIEKDLTDAEKYIGNNVRESRDKYGIDKYVVQGLLARYYLLSQQWEKAANAANKARSGYEISTVSEYGGFLSIDNKEIMWGCRHNSETSNIYASFFSHMSNLSPGYASMNGQKLVDKSLYDQMDKDDARQDWVDTLIVSPIPGVYDTIPLANVKFGPSNDFTAPDVYMRAAEMVLIEAEAYAHMGNGQKAAEVLSVLMEKRVPKWNKASVTVEDVYLQRRLELWGEGFTVFDLKRLGKGMCRAYKGSNHFGPVQFNIPAGDICWTYQIPKKEIQENPLISEEDQNP